MKRISLIANSGIQYIKFTTEINKDFGKIPENKIYYRDSFDINTDEYVLDPLFKYTKDGDSVFFRKQELYQGDYLANGRIKEDMDLSLLQSFYTADEESNLSHTLKTFRRKWIPLPYFKDNSINKDVLYPTDWVRVFVDYDEEFTTAKVIIAVDTLLAQNENDRTSPQLSLNRDENLFKLSDSDLNIANVLSDPHFSSKWIDKYIADIFYGKNEENRYDKPYKRYVARYLFFIKWLGSLMQIPEIQLFTDRMKKKEVDLVIDVGNSATCALLFENKDDNSFDFESVKKLIIQDYTQPDKEYAEPFPMNVVFSESKFGEINDTSDNKKFTVPSLVRIGWEAEELINSSVTDLSLGYELKTYNSSPKRYLWDDTPSDREWEFNPKDYRNIRKVYLNGITNQLRTDGELVKGNEMFMSKPMFSRKSLMKFVFLEILVHAYTQINSYAFREEHGQMTIPRTLKRITLSCPTAMIQAEQVALRQAAEEACELLKNYATYYFDGNYENFWFEKPEIIPATSDIKKKLSDLESRKDWSYDEATCCQLVFLYSLIVKKLKGNNYVIDNYLFKGKPSLKVASVDIGAGTTDILVHQYTLTENGKDSDLLKPTPLFWDSFKFAGDDLLKEIIQKIIIEGEEKTPAEEGASGVIQNYGIRQGITNMSERLNSFFGEDTNQMGYKGRVIRQAFVHQVAIPIALAYLKSANKSEGTPEIKKFEEIIGKKFQNKELLNSFEKHFGFDLLEIPWKIDPERVNAIVTSVFDALIRQICVVFNQFQCDFVVLSGKPASLGSFENIFKKYLTISPSNLINLNTYWIGRWYPFADGNGFITDPKTVVSVGAIVALMAGKLFKIKELKIDTSEVTQKLISTADYIVRITDNNKETILSPKKNDNELEVSTIPFHFGYSKYLAKNYPYADLYSIRMDEKEIEAHIRRKYPSQDQNFIKEQIEKEKNTIRQNLPLKVELSRDYEESKEVIQITRVEDAQGNDKPNKYFTLHYQTLEDEKGYWLDKCEFILNAK